MGKSFNPISEPDNIFEYFFQESDKPFGLIQWDIATEKPEFFISRANASLMQILSINPENLPIKTLSAFAIIKGYNNQFLSLFLANNKKKSIEITYQLGKNHYKVNFTKLSIQAIAFHFEEINELQQNRIELFERKRQLKESHEIAKLGYWIENHNSTNHFWSEQIFNLLQVKDQKIKPSFATYLNFVHPHDKTLVEESFNEAKATHTGFELNHRLNLADGSTRYITLRCYTNYNSKGLAAQTVGIIQDITTAENTRIALRKSETMFRSVFDNAPIAIVLVNNEFSPTFCNQQFSQITGYSMPEIMQMNLKDFTFSDDLENNQQQYIRLFNNQISSFSLTKRYRKRDNSLIWVKVIVSAIKNEQNKTFTAIAMVQDISAEKKAAESLMKSEYRYRTLIENANDGIGLFDLNFKPIIYNTTLYEMLGFTLESYLKINHNKFELFHPDDIKHGEKAIECIHNKKQIRIECRLKNSKGIYKFYAVSYIPVLHEDQPAILIFRRDISKRKEAELQNEEYRLFLETIMDNLPVSFFAKTTPDFRYLYWNNMMEQVTGISAEDALYKTDFEIQQSKSLAKQYQQEDEKLVKHKKKLEREHNLTNALGEIKHFKTIKTIHQSSTGNPIILGLSMDVSQLKDAEQKIEQSTQMLKEAQKIAKLGYWEYDVKKDLFFDNVENRQILGIIDVPYFLNAAQFKELVHPSDQEMVAESFRSCIEHNKPGEGIIRIMTTTGLKHISINYKPFTNESNKVFKLRGTCLDISRIRESETALRESENRLKQAEHIAKVGYWEYNYKDKTTQFSDEVWNILETPQNARFNNFSDFGSVVHPDDKQAVYQQFQQSSTGNQAFEFDFKIITQNKHIKHVRAIGTFERNPDGRLDRSIGTFQDITSLKQNEFKLKKASCHLINIQKLAKTGFIEINLDNHEVSYSNSLYNLLEVSELEPNATFSFYENFIFSEDKNTIAKTLAHTIETNGTHNIQYRLLLPNGIIKYVNEICHIIPGNHTNKGIVTRIIQDITHIREKEFEHLQLNEIKKQAQIGIWEYNKENNRYHFSDEAKAILGISAEITQVLFADYVQMIHPEDRYSVEKIIKESLKNKQNYNLSYRIICKDSQQTKYVQDSSSFKTTRTNRWIISGTIRDISAYRKTLKTLSEHSELLKLITENALMGMVIFQNDKHIYVNNRWCHLTGMQANEVENKLSINEIYQPETNRLILGLLVQWSKYRIKEYRNQVHIKPLKAPGFYAEMYVKETINNNAPAFLILISPRHK
jgi:PAS domain S-box-containing protein